MNHDTIIELIGTAVLGLSGWTLLTLHKLVAKHAATEAHSEEHAIAQDARISENRTRIITVEQKVQDLEVDVATFKGRKA